MHPTKTPEHTHKHTEITTGVRPSVNSLQLTSWQKGSILVSASSLAALRLGNTSFTLTLNAVPAADVHLTVTSPSVMHDA